MNSLLFQFIESKNLAWHIGKKDNTRPEKMILEDPGKLRLKKILLANNYVNSILSSPPTGLPLLNPSGVERNGRVTIFVIIIKQHYDSFSSGVYFLDLKQVFHRVNHGFYSPLSLLIRRLRKSGFVGTDAYWCLLYLTEECGTFVHAQRWLLSKIHEYLSLPIYGVVSHMRVSWYSAPAGQPKNETNSTLIAPSWFLRVKKMILLHD